MPLFPAYSSSADGTLILDEIIPLPPVPAPSSSSCHAVPPQPCLTSSIGDKANFAPASASGTAQTSLEQELEALLSDPDSENHDVSEADAKKQHKKHKPKKRKDKKKKKKKKKKKHRKRRSSSSSVDQSDGDNTIKDDGDDALVSKGEVKTKPDGAGVVVPNGEDGANLKGDYAAGPNSNGDASTKMLDRGDIIEPNKGEKAAELYSGGTKELNNGEDIIKRDDDAVQPSRNEDVTNIDDGHNRKVNDPNTTKNDSENTAKPVGAGFAVYSPQSTCKNTVIRDEDTTEVSGEERLKPVANMDGKLKDITEASIQDGEKSLSLQNGDGVTGSDSESSSVPPTVQKKRSRSKSCENESPSERYSETSQSISRINKSKVILDHHNRPHRSLSNSQESDANKSRYKSLEGKNESARSKLSDSKDKSPSKSHEKRSQSKSRKKSNKSRSKSREKRHRSRSKSREKRHKSHSKSRDKRHKSRSRSREKQQRSRSHDKLQRSRSRDREQRSRSRDRLHRTRSRDRLPRTRSRDRLQKTWSRDRQQRSRSKSPDQSRRSRSRSRDRKRRRTPSNSRDRRHKRSRSSTREKRCRRSQSRSRGRRRRTSRSRSRERTSKRSRSRSATRRSESSRNKRRKRSRSHGGGRSRSVSGSTNKKDKTKLSGDSSRYIAGGCVLASKNKSLFVDMSSFVRPEYVVYTDTTGDKNNLAFATTHYTQLAKYKVHCRVLGEATVQNKLKKKLIRYFQKKVRNLLLQNAVACTPIQVISDDELLEKDYIPTDLTYAETLKVSKQKTEEVKEAYKKSSFYLDSVNIADGTKEVTSDDTEHDYWLKQSKSYNERLSKDTKNEQLWLEFVRFQDRAFVHIFSGESGVMDSSGKGISKSGRSSKSSARALAERKLSLLDASIKKNPHSLALQLERLVVGDEVWELEQLNREWATLVYNFPNNMAVWQRYIQHHATSSLQFRVSSAVSAAGRCCEKLRLMATGVFVTHAPPQQPGLCCVDVIAQVCRLWAQSGHRERGIALWQALLEYNLFSPAGLAATPHAHRLPLFEQFWDSRAPRVGEEGSLGWGVALQARQTAQYMDQILEGQFDEEDQLIEDAVSRHPILRTLRPNLEAEEEDDDQNDEYGLLPTEQDCSSKEEALRIQQEKARREQERAEYDASLSELWLRLEQLRERRHWLPYAADPDDCEDPDRMVSFEVLAPFIVTLPLTDGEKKTEVKVTARFNKQWEADTQYEKFYLLLRFLDFLGVEVDDVERNFFEHLEIYDHDNNCFESLRLENLESLFTSDVLSVCQDYGKLNSLVLSTGPSICDSICDSYFKFVCNVIERTLPQFNTEYSAYLAILYIRVLIQRCIAFQQISWKGIGQKKVEKAYKKLAKSILKRDNLRSHLLVYREYGALEECLGNFVEAEKVYTAALLQASKDIQDVFECDPATFGRVASVCFSYIRLHLTASANYKGKDAFVHTTSVLSVLCALANEGRVLDADFVPVPPASQLRAMKKLAELLEIALLSFIKSKKLTTYNNRMIVELCTYLSLLQFFNSGFKSFCLIFEDAISRIETLECSKNSTTTATPGTNISSPATPCHVTQLLLRALHERYAWLCVVLPRVQDGAASTPVLCSPADRRDSVQRGLRAAPHSTFLLALQATLQSWRDLFVGVGSESSTARQLVFRVVPHLAAARAMLHNTVTDAGSSPGAMCVPRTLLSVVRSAVRRPAGRHCPLLWRLALHWAGLMRRHGSHDPHDMLYTALTTCPGNKSVYLSGVSSSGGSGTALRSVVRLMEERGLRCRLPLQELELLLQEEHEERRDKIAEEEHTCGSDKVPVKEVSYEQRVNDTHIPQETISDTETIALPTDSLQLQPKELSGAKEAYSNINGEHCSEVPNVDNDSM